MSDSTSPSSVDVERDRIDSIYNAARMAAMAEYDSLIPRFKQVEQRLIHLRSIIRGTSHVLGLPVADPYGWGPLNPDARQRGRITTQRVR